MSWPLLFLKQLCEQCSFIISNSGRVLLRFKKKLASSLLRRVWQAAVRRSVRQYALCRLLHSCRCGIIGPLFGKLHDIYFQIMIQMVTVTSAGVL